MAEQNAQLLHEREKELALYTEQHDSLCERQTSLEQIVSTAIIHNERPVYIKTRLSALEDAISEYRKDIAALDIASDVMSDALSVMRFKIKEHLKDSVNYLLKYTLQDNESLVIDDNYRLQYKNGSRLFPVFSDNISRASRVAKGISRSLCEMAALALRIALIQLLESESSAVIFDEPFAFMDASCEDRMIKKLSNSDILQVFLFTSHRIEGAEDKYNCIHLI